MKNKHLWYNGAHAPACPIDAPFLCAPSPFWTAPACVSSASECDSVHSIRVGYPVLHFAYTAGNYDLLMVEDAVSSYQAKVGHSLHTIQSLDADIASDPNFATVCPSGTAMCPFTDLLSTVTCASPSDLTKCTTPITCSAGRTLCGDGFCYTPSVEHRLDAAIDILQDPTISENEAISFLTTFAPRNACPPHTTLTNSVPYTRPTHCPPTIPFKCEDMSCVTSPEECIAGHLHTFSTVFIDVFEDMYTEIPPTLISGRRLGSTSAWDDFLNSAHQALTTVHDIVTDITECPDGQYRTAVGNCVVSMADMFHTSSLFFERISCERQYALPFWVTLFSPVIVPTFDPVSQEMLCHDEEKCTVDISTCSATQEVCTSDTPWHCAIYETCTGSRLGCDIAAITSDSSSTTASATQTSSPSATSTASISSSATLSASPSTSSLPGTVIDAGGEEKSWVEDNIPWLILLILALAAMLLVAFLVAMTRRRKRRREVLYKLDQDGKPIRLNLVNGPTKLQAITKHNPLSEKKGLSLHPVKLFGIKSIDNKHSTVEAGEEMPSARSRATAMSLALSGRSVDVEARGSLASAREAATNDTPRGFKRSNRFSTGDPKAFFPMTSGTQTEGSPNKRRSSRVSSGTPGKSPLNSPTRTAVLSTDMDPNNRSFGSRVPIPSYAPTEGFSVTKSTAPRTGEKRSPKGNTRARLSPSQTSENEPRPTLASVSLQSVDPSRRASGRPTADSGEINVSYSPGTGRKSKRDTIASKRRSTASGAEDLMRRSISSAIQRQSLVMQTEGKSSPKDNGNKQGSPSPLNRTIVSPLDVDRDLDLTSSLKSSNPNMFSHRRSMRVSQFPQRLDRSRGTDGMGRSSDKNKLSNLLSYAASTAGRTNNHSRSTSATTVSRTQFQYPTTRRKRSTATSRGSHPSETPISRVSTPHSSLNTTAEWSDIEPTSQDPNISIHSDISSITDNSYWLPASTSSLPDSVDSRLTYHGNQAKRRVFQNFVSPLSDISGMSSVNTSLDYYPTFDADQHEDEFISFENPYHQRAEPSRSTTYRR